MSKEFYFEKSYKDTDFSPEELKLLKSRMMDFGQVWGMSINLIKRNFKRVFLFPALWQLLIGGLALLLIAFMVFGTVLNNIDPAIFKNIVDGNTASSILDPTKQNSEWSEAELERYLSGDASQSAYYSDDMMVMRTLVSLGTAFFGIFVLALALILVISIVFTLIRLRQISILNTKSVASIWKTSRGFYYDLLKLVTIWIGYGIVSGIITSVFMAISPEFSNLVSLAIQTVAYGFFGICVYLIVIEEYGLTESLQLSFKLMKPVFW